MMPQRRPDGTTLRRDRSYAMICRRGQPAHINLPGRSDSDFPVANRSQHPYTLEGKRELLARPVWAVFGPPQRRGRGAVRERRVFSGTGSEAAFPALRYEFRFLSDRTVVGVMYVADNPIGRGQMARKRTRRDAIEHDDCRFAMLHLSALINHTGAHEAELLRAPTPKPFASHCATRRGPAIRNPLVGARARGVFYGYQENAGGCHPPGRNTDRRH